MFKYFTKRFLRNLRYFYLRSSVCLKEIKLGIFTVQIGSGTSLVFLFSVLVRLYIHNENNQIYSKTYNVSGEKIDLKI